MQVCGETLFPASEKEAWRRKVVALPGRVFSFFLLPIFSSGPHVFVGNGGFNAFSTMLALRRRLQE